ncbi:PREDICTED: methylsterol monooxygenase 1-1-like [Nicotiana attenuata]|uniref:Methylsterol monooxygenase 1-1 n=1 Tax=Nicotiana attenuata TaxID=49451 RepID=A0A314KIB2_NICAT|nr:PREDICTED: methylsterol monooxygenase 1-1-like [Nicotiana attenuata]OIT29085.1 methylsterol monooxygenase 1-1 [Nicotiana attenuata]
MLPFESIQEAEMSLGRNLTFAETLWFKYTADKSDLYLYCHNTIFLIIFYTLVPLPMVIIELLRSKKLEIYKIQPKIRFSLSEMMECYRKVLTTFVFAVSPLQFFSYPIIQWVGIRTSLPLPSASEVFWQLLVYFLVEDYANYWLHRMLHHYKWGYDKIHRIHHEYVAPIGFAAPYAHWAEIIILGLASFLGPLMVPCHMFTFWLWFVLRQIEAIETHSGYEFPWSPSKYIPFYGGAIYHDYHHFVGESCHSNFASVFTYCDYIYGTDKGYRYQKEVFEKRREKLRSMEDNVNGSTTPFKSE